jgi:hypothetical protein
MKALVLNALGRGFDFEDVQIATPKIGGTWRFAERLLYVDWIEERVLS